jgi:hypothetical protein
MTKVLTRYKEKSFPAPVMSNNTFSQLKEQLPGCFQKVDRFDTAMVEFGCDDWIPTTEHLKTFFRNIYKKKEEEEEEKEEDEMEFEGDDSSSMSEEDLFFGGYDSDEDDFTTRKKEWPNDQECIAWSGSFAVSKANSKYPIFYMNRHKWSARTLMYHWFVDSARKVASTTGKIITKSVYVTCGNTMCVNPSHLTVRKRGARNPQIGDDTFSWEQEDVWGGLSTFHTVVTPLRKKICTMNDKHDVVEPLCSSLPPPILPNLQRYISSARHVMKQG